MRYIKEYKEIDFDDFDEEEELLSDITKSNITGYFITYEENKQAIEIAKKLIDMEFKVYNIEKILDNRCNNNWDKFTYDITDRDWTRSKRESSDLISEGLVEMKYDTFIKGILEKMYWDFDEEEELPIDIDTDKFLMIDLYNQCGGDLDLLCQWMNDNLTNKRLNIIDKNGEIVLNNRYKAFSKGDRNIIDRLIEHGSDGTLVMSEGDAHIYIKDTIVVLGDG